jgi:hypothetical protein
LPRSDYANLPPIVVNTAYREHLVDLGLLVPVERRGTHATYVHDEPPTLRMLGTENTAAVAWRDLREREEP